MTGNERAELLARIGCGPLASRTPINNSVYPELGLPHRVGRIDRRDHRLGPRFIGVVDIWMDF